MGAAVVLVIVVFMVMAVVVVFDNHLQNLERVFDRSKERGLKPSAPKVYLFCSEVNYLGYAVGREGIRPLGSNIHVISEVPASRTFKHVKSFNGIVIFLKKFIPNSADIMRP